MRSNNSSSSIPQVGHAPSGGKLKLATFCAVASLTNFLTAMPSHAHKVVSDYELTPISLPGASGVVALDYFAYDRNDAACTGRSEEHTSELQSRQYLVCRLLLEKKKKRK